MSDYCPSCGFNENVEGWKICKKCGQRRLFVRPSQPKPKTVESEQAEEITSKINDNYDELDINSLKQKAESGDAQAQFVLANKYRYGDEEAGIVENIPKAIELLTKAATSGHVSSQKVIANIYYSGNDVKENKSEAFKWYLMAAESGDAGSQLKVGDMYISGEGIETNSSKAYEWYAKAANQFSEMAGNNDLDAMHSLAGMYDEGKYFKEDKEKAFELYKKTADKGGWLSQEEIGKRSLLGIGCEKNVEVAKHYYFLRIGNQISSEDFEEICTSLILKCAEMLSDGSCFYSILNIDETKLSNAMNTFLAPIPDDETPLMYVDNTVWGSGKDGLAITCKRVTWRLDFLCMSYNELLKWEGFEKIEVISKNLGTQSHLEANLKDFSKRFICMNQTAESKIQIVADLIMLLHALWKKYGK